MSCCWLWLFCTCPSFLVDRRLGCWPRRVFPSGGGTGRRAELAADREKGRASWRQAGLPAQSLRRHRFRRALRALICTFCMRVCIYVYVCMCADMIYVYICMCVYICTSMRLYTCVCVCVCIFVHRLWVLVSVFQCVDGVMHAHVFSCAYACVYVCL